jgi:pimeloyl-ACP methyl ester carboxylesterase
MDTYTRDGLTFDVTDRGPADGRLVILLHGFPEDRHCWDPLLPALLEAGFRVVAPDQRGYSPGARPPGRHHYTLDLLAGDVLALADAAGGGAGAGRFDLVGHDWGAAVAWHLAGTRPDRVRSLTALSVPHGRALLDATFRSPQLIRSWYMLFFQLPWVPEAIFRLAGVDRLAARLERSGLDQPSARRYAARAATPRSIGGPLNWYRALSLQRGGRAEPVTVPTLYLWGRGDRFITKVAAERCGRHVAGPFRFLPIDGATHWLPSADPAEVAPALLAHLSATTG